MPLLFAPLHRPKAGCTFALLDSDLHPNLNLNTRTWFPITETWDPKVPLTFAPLHRPQADLHFCTMMCRAFGASHHLPGDLEIFRGINRHRMIVSDNGLESKSMREEAQLLE